MAVSAELIRHIQSVYPLEDKSLHHLTELFEPVELPKGHLLFRMGRVSKDLYFIEKGIARAFCYKDDKEVTFWFGMEGQAVLSYNSYIYGNPGYESIELLEPSLLFRINYYALQQLFLSDASLANWGRKLAEKELVKTEERFISHLFQSATERYRQLLEQMPELLQRVPLGHIASYLGVTQVTLSRIRADFK